MRSGESRNPESVVREIRRKSRRKFSSEEKIRIVLEGVKGEEGVSTICRREGITTGLYYRCSKHFLEAGKKRLKGDTQRNRCIPSIPSMRTPSCGTQSIIVALTPCLASSYARRSQSEIYLEQIQETATARLPIRFIGMTPDLQHVCANS